MTNEEKISRALLFLSDGYKDYEESLSLTSYEPWRNILEKNMEAIKYTMEILTKSIPIKFIEDYASKLEETEKFHDTANIKELGIKQMLKAWEEYNESNISN